VSASIAFVSISVVLFAYWFRYTCLLILSARPTNDFAARVAATSLGLRFLHVQASLSEQGASLDLLQTGLDNDYVTLMRFMRESKVRADLVEATMLKVHYAAMRTFCRVTRRMAPGSARVALRHMADTINYFAGITGQCATRA